MGKRGFMDGYRTYDPRAEGYGNARAWTQEFRATMNLDEARRHVGAESPEAILGVRLGASWTEIKSAYRKAAYACHPDRCAVHGLSAAVATERFKRLLAAFTILEDRRR